MPILRVPDGAEINYVVDRFAWPWETPETILCVHGLAESTKAWVPWIPYLARLGAVVRMDQRGFGESSPMAEDFAWSLDMMAGDVIRIIEAVSPEGAHVVGAKIAGPVTIRAATRRPDLIKTLTLVGTPIKGPSEDKWISTVEENGVRPWAEGTMDVRLEGMSDEAKAYWTDMMAATPKSTILGFFRFVTTIDVEDDLAKIRCPTLVIASDNVRRPIQETEAWQKTIPNSEISVVPGSGYHAAATEAVFCAKATSAFIAKHMGAEELL